jgi:hypothetical protein
MAGIMRLLAKHETAEVFEGGEGPVPGELLPPGSPRKHEDTKKTKGFRDF